MTTATGARPRKRPWWRGAPGMAIAVLALAGAGTAWYLKDSGAEESYTTATASVTTIRQSISMTGTLEAVNEADVDFAVSGKVTTVPVQAGQAVTAGQTLATVDASTLDLELSKAQAMLSSAAAKLDADQEAFDAGEEGAPTQAQLDSDQASVESAYAAVASAQTDLANATLTAPIAGTVVAVNTAVGDLITSGSSSSSSSSNTASTASTESSSDNQPSSASTAQGANSSSANSSAASDSSSNSNATFVIQDLSSFQVSGTVTSGNVSSVTPGMAAVITPSSSGTTVQGTVTSVNAIPTVTNGTATFPVVVSVTGSTDGLYSGVSATVALVTSETPNALTVPSAAVTTSNGTSTVNKVVNGAPVTTKVGVGVSSGSVTQITSGLKEGDTVAVPAATTSASNSSQSGDRGVFSTGGPPSGEGFTGGPGGPPPGGGG